MYDLSDLITALRNPKRPLWEVTWHLHRRVRGQEGVNVMQQDWDNLIILDGCRYDTFEDLSTISGELTSVVSRGSSTPEFIHRTFRTSTERHDDTVYVSANPQFDRHSVQESFHTYIPAWESEWDDELNTVPPEALADKAAEVAEEFPEKRVVAHFIQPHYPFIGPTGQQIRHRTVHGGGVVDDPSEVERSVWERLEDGDLSKEVVQKAYRENLELTLPHVRQLIEQLGGKTVLTSDHGNSFGRYGVYGHPSKYFLKDLVEVPWLETGDGSRRSISEGSANQSTPVNEDVEERLADLGYK